MSSGQATELVKQGYAEWLLEYREDGVFPTWDIVMYRSLKTPRAATMESAHMERAVERAEISDSGDFSEEIQEDLGKAIQRADEWHDINLEERFLLFRGIGRELLALKRDSDDFGTLEGSAGKNLVDKIIHKADTLKGRAFKDDPEPGQAIFLLIGLDQRTWTGQKERKK